ncbi:hypothetical protein C8P63_11738 [Melghirimyces profundicolus]|uniref:C2H2-type domain-containing protein n=1 Tax=Melghirimyces profundicolus TaxID=1242148 RepID=A0A2T6BQC1_9BACL|nr:zinc ribbon domain-containing protein [Melghirimyces profundicolus]PTX58291.1 hypothetical protein C8P63_11738 [Melghirimyces profundicolus]
MDLLTGLRQKLEKGIESTSQRSKKVLHISRITLLIRNKKENEDELYRRLGREVHRYWEMKGRLDLTDLTRATLQQIRDVREKIAELEQSVEKLKQQEEVPPPEKERNREKIPAPDSGYSKAEEEKVEEEKPAPPGPSREEEENTAPPFLGEGEAIFVCPHCGDQIEEKTVICSHCKKHVYHD